MKCLLTDVFLRKWNNKATNMTSEQSHGPHWTANNKCCTLVKIGLSGSLEISVPKVATSPLFVKDSKQVASLQCAAAVWYSFSITHHSVSCNFFLSAVNITFTIKNWYCLSWGFLLIICNNWICQNMSQLTWMWRGRFGPATFTLIINHCCLLTGKAVLCTMKCGWGNIDKGFVFSNKWHEWYNLTGLTDKTIDNSSCGRTASVQSEMCLSELWNYITFYRSFLPDFRYLHGFLSRGQCTGWWLWWSLALWQGWMLPKLAVVTTFWLVWSPFQGLTQLPYHEHSDVKWHRILYSSHVFLNC